MRQTHVRSISCHPKWVAPVSLRVYPRSKALSKESLTDTFHTGCRTESPIGWRSIPPWMSTESPFDSMSIPCWMSDESPYSRNPFRPGCLQEGKQMISATSRYCNMWTEWKRTVPERLAAEDPKILSQFLTYASSDAGVSRSELERELGLKQPRVSKLSAKLLDEQWIEVVEKSEGDGRLEFIRTSSLARKIMGDLENLLCALSPRPPVARRVGARSGRLRVPERAIGSLLETQTSKVQAK